MKLILQKRDTEILGLAYEHQFILTEHMERCFAGACYRVARKRIKRLCDEGFLRQDGTMLGRQPTYRVTPEGARIALQNGAAPVGQVKTLNLSTLTHDSMVLGVRQRLEALWTGRFTCERALKESEYQEVPDGIFTFKSSRAVAVEVELSDKGRTRFGKLLKRWDAVNSINLVLYVTQPTFFETLKRYVSEGGISKPVGVVLWGDLVKGAPPLWTPRGELGLFDQREF
ncbi:MAG TPA: hypothetical protein DCS07_01325 [Bdellovibrionales bacterium]|nr:MAG: hypothetical protein A2Z97_04210 [Bdellovibrionales bacterium GWB1_52_6]OFZ02439.1 MAG: hypothetical protein A2X97_12885 [Bdellovibrionales bacterium GWA1_52_35]OFZ39326.1 MAG: hypothetical protein A2070_00665 [Bdellovibrionales bacterium GWC1_52_8]HAR41267.1 hypothetical protein [Bdellovibrionales bacterium]HCM41533.1 hypothetical protein [Bdellovibrionales bacterium]